MSVAEGRMLPHHKLTLFKWDKALQNLSGLSSHSDLCLVKIKPEFAQREKISWLQTVFLGLQVQLVLLKVKAIYKKIQYLRNALVVCLLTVETTQSPFVVFVVFYGDVVLILS